MTEAARAAVIAVLNLLIRGEYIALANMTGNRRLTAEMLERAIRTYGKTLTWPTGSTLPPDLDEIDDVTDPRKSHYVMTLWTEEEGESDLSLELTLLEIAAGIYEVEIDDLHVL